MVASAVLNHVGDKLGGDGRSALVLFVLSSVWEEGNDSGDPLRTGDLARMNHDAKLH